MTPHLRELLSAFDPDLPLERAHTIPAAWYHDLALFALEKQAIFGDAWQPVARTETVAEPGAYAAAEVAGEPVLVVRGADGVLRGFFNVCRHRAAAIITEPCGKATRLRCRYHGWTYDLAGRLRGTPEFDGVANFDREENGLLAITVACWGPYIWAHLRQPMTAIEDYLGPLCEPSTAARLAPLRWAARREYEVACNWKVYVDNYLDGGYHVNSVHPALAGVLDYAHYRTELHGNTSVQISPLHPSGDAGVDAVRSGAVACYWWVFPNFMLNLYEGVMDTHLVIPVAPDRCRVVFDFYIAEPDRPGRQQFIEESIRVAHQVQLEDMEICAQVQHGLTSRSFDTGRFSVRRESAVYHFHQLLARRLLAS
jgi:choline monooxygenase